MVVDRSPGGTYAEIVDLRSLIRRVPALNSPLQVGAQTCTRLLAFGEN
jgi:hypothetical protein